MPTIDKLQHSIPRTKAILAFMLAITLFSLTNGLDFNYSTFGDTDRPDFIFSNNSNIAYEALQITPDTRNPDPNYTANKSGRVLYKETFKLWKKDRTIITSFDTNFTFNIVPLTTPGGEGLAFILINNPGLPMNSSGQWLGITNYTMNHSPLNYIVAVEFDTSKSYTDDVDGNHLGINVDGIDSMVQYTLTDFGVNLSSSSDVSVNIRYDGVSRLLNINISMVANSMSRSVSHPIDLSLFLLQDVYVGFAGSTSNHTQLNCVKSWSFSSPDIGSGGDWKNLKWISLSSLIVIPIGAMAFFWWKKVRKINPVEAVTRAPPAAGHGEFGLEELRLATNNFSEDNILGVGGSGKVYKGFLIGPGRDVAIKRLYNPRLSEKAFEAERETVGRLFHKNLVKLLGWCSEGDESLLVYEYFRKGSLDKLLFPSNANVAAADDDVIGRRWETRLKIIKGVARALEYLHEWCEHVILHRDVKSSNVMVDDEYDARLGDFGLARRVEPVGATHHCTDTVAGTMGYVPPEGLNENWVRKANDVYGFGVFVMEVACGRRPGNPWTRPPRGEGYIVEWLWTLHVNDMLLCGVDHRLEVLDGEQMKRVLLLGLACCHPDYERRPSMGTVSLVLADLASPPDLPNEMPNFVWASTGRANHRPTFDETLRRGSDNQV